MPSETKLTEFISVLQASRSVLAVANKMMTASRGETLAKAIEDCFELKKALIESVAELFGGEPAIAAQLDPVISGFLARLPERYLADRERWLSEILPALTLLKDRRVKNELITPFMEEQEQSQSSVIASIKLPLFRSCIDLQTLAQNYPCGYTAKELIGWGFDQIVQLTQKVSLEWSDDIDLLGRQKLFLEILPIIGEITCDTVRREVQVNLSTDIEPLNLAHFTAQLLLLKKTIKDNPMGCEDDDGSVDILLSRLGRFIYDDLAPVYANAHFDTAVFSFWIGSMVKILDRYAAEAWNKTAGEIRGYYDSLEESSYAALIADKGRLQDMAISTFKEWMQRSRSQWLHADNQPLDLVVISKKIEQQVINLWGMSDAICRMA